MQEMQCTQCTQHHSVVWPNIFWILIVQTKLRCVVTIFRMFWHEMEFCLVPNQLDIGKYNLILVWFNKIQKKMSLCAWSIGIQHRENKNSLSCSIRIDIYCNYTFSDLEPNLVLFCSKSIRGSVFTIQTHFDLTRRIFIFPSLCTDSWNAAKLGNLQRNGVQPSKRLTSLIISEAQLKAPETCRT